MGKLFGRKRRYSDSWSSLSPFLQPDTRAFKPCSFSWDGQFNYISCKMTVTPVSQMSSLRMSLKEVPTTITPKYLGRARNTWPLSLIGKVGSEKERLRDHAPHSRSTISLCTSAPCPLHDASQQWLTGQGTLHFQILNFRSGLQGFIDIELKLDWRFFQTNEGVAHVWPIDHTARIRPIDDTARRRPIVSTAPRRPTVSTARRRPTVSTARRRPSVTTVNISPWLLWPSFKK